jgi:hypothetical protein
VDGSGDVLDGGNGSSSDADHDAEADAYVPVCRRVDGGCTGDCCPGGVQGRPVDFARACLERRVEVVSCVTRRSPTADCYELAAVTCWSRQLVDGGVEAWELDSTPPASEDRTVEDCAGNLAAMIRAMP